MTKKTHAISGSFVQDIKSIIGQSRAQAVRSVEFYRVQMYWKLGERIFNEEQQGKERADYGTYLIRNLSRELEPEFGSGFSYRQLERCRQFYREFPIESAVRTQLNWSQYKMLITIEDNDKREYYELEAVKNAWTGRELERQISSGLFERLLLSTDKESVMAENFAFGFWPGGKNYAQAAFYSYFYPAPEGIEIPGNPGNNYYDDKMKEYILDYQSVADSQNPEETILRFLNDTYHNGAILAGWDVESLKAEMPVEYKVI